MYAAEPRATPGSPVGNLLGDFTLTLDQTAAGSRRAAADRRQRPPRRRDTVGGACSAPAACMTVSRSPVTIDPVLTDRRIGVRDVSVHDVPGSDDRSVIAFLTL